VRKSWKCTEEASVSGEKNNKEELSHRMTSHKKSQHAKRVETALVGTFPMIVDMGESHTMQKKKELPTAIGEKKSEHQHSIAGASLTKRGRTKGRVGHGEKANTEKACKQGLSVGQVATD